MDERLCRNIIGLLRDAQNGRSIGELSQELGLSRTTTTKYLNSLFASGQVDMRKAGPAKIFSLATRLPTEQILSRSPDPLMVLDEAYTVLEVSASLLRAFSITEDQIKNLSVHATAIGAGLIDRIRSPLQKAMAGKEVVVCAWIPVQKEWKAFRIRILPLVFSWADKGVVIILEDRTGEVMAQEENALLADLVNAFPAAITVHDFEGNFLYSNEKNLGLHGYTLREFLDLNLARLDSPESALRISGHLDNIRKDGETSFEVAHFRKDGRLLSLEVHATITRWGDRDVIVSIATDISGRKQAENALKESERRLAGIIDFLPDAIVVVDGGGTIIAWNRAMEEMTGVTARTILGKGLDAYKIAVYGTLQPVLTDLILGDDPDVGRYYRNLRRQGSTVTAEKVLAFPGNGERVVWLKASPFYDKDGRITGTIESIRDITGWKRPGEEHR